MEGLSVLHRNSCSHCT